MSAPNLALVAVVGGRACLLYDDTDEHIGDHMQCVGEPDALAESVWDDAGVWVCSLALVDDGPSDWGWGDIRDVRLDATELRAPTTEEWSRYLDDEHLWRTCEEIGEAPDDHDEPQEAAGKWP